MTTLYGLGGYFLTLVVILMIYKRKSLRKNQLYSMATFIGISIIIVTSQFLIPYLLITGFAAALALTMTYLTLQNPVETLDDLTGVFNRTALSHHIKELENLGGIQHFAVISLDDFAGIVKAVGVARGNTFLSIFTDFMKSHSENAQIFRYGNDVFVACFQHEGKLKEFVDNMERRVLFPWVLGDLEIGISASMYYSDGIPPIIKEDRLSLVIDQMLFKGKELGNRITIPINQQEITEILQIYNIEEALGLALEEERLDIYLQPIYCPKNDMFVSAEALVRFTDEKIGTVNPDDFIPLAEKNGMIFQIGRQVMRKVCRFVDENQVYENSGLNKINVNLSILEAVRSDLVASIENCHKGRNIPYGFIGFEITETNASLGGDLFIKNMLELVDKGFSFAMDDFGTGYANLDSIIGLPFQAVKLDGALISAGKKNEKMYIILTEHIQMFKRMGLTVIVEGVETRDQVELLKDLPVDLIQGYYYAKPMPMRAAVEFIREYNRGKKQNESNN